MIDMLMTVATLFALAFLDALSTYVVITLGVGVEANPALADIVNNNPVTIFPIELTSVALVSAVAVAVDRLSRRLPAPIRAKVMRLLASALLVAAVLRAAVVVNNLLLLS
jgi:hypothetical protein